jgi:hypothetical protein
LLERFFRPSAVQNDFACLPERSEGSPVHSIV